MRCKTCNIKFEVVYFNQKYCSNDCKHKAEKQPKKKAKRKYKCKQCKEPFERTISSVQPVCSTKCAIEYSKVLEAKKRRKETRDLKQSMKTWMDYYQEALKVFNSYIRERDKNEKCISCDALPGTYKLTSGHYFPQGQNKSVALDEDNAHSQCWFNCNKNKSGNLAEYYPRLIKKIGQQRFDELEQRKNTLKKYSIPELIEIKVIFKDKTKQLKQTK